MESSFKPIQKIIFGSPGTGKSYKVVEIAKDELKIELDSKTNTLKNTVKAVFHPEYTYSDFVGKLLPYTYGNSVVYKYYPGHFLKALGMAYRGLFDNNQENYLLVIDELNRGNAAAIFGSIFQLLDRGDDGWSAYEVDFSALELVGLFKAMGYSAEISYKGRMLIDEIPLEKFDFSDKNLSEILCSKLKNHKISIPPNLSIIATINTSDESIYYLDSAFKRRWDWEYIDAPSKTDLNKVPDSIKNTELDINGNKLKWTECIVAINEFIKSHSKSIRKVEDKQIGWWFIKPQKEGITLDQVKDKLMFYLWDSVFARDKKPLVQFFENELGIQDNLVTYAEFVKDTEKFIERIHSKFNPSSSESEDKGQ